jgi:hypothetical protein
MASKEERPCILLVEDDRLTRTVLRHDLKLHGFDGTRICSRFVTSEFAFVCLDGTNAALQLISLRTETLLLKNFIEQRGTGK